MNKQFSSTRENYTITATIEVISNDLLIVITGGNHAHIGSVTNVSKDTEISSYRFPSHSGRFHKDHYLAEQMANIIKPYLPGNATISSGVHVDHITQKQILAAGDMITDLSTKIVSWLEKNPIHTAAPVYYGADEKPE